MSAHDRLDWDRDGADWPHRIHSRFVSAGGMRWHVQDFPSGAPAGSEAPHAPILLLHGTGSASQSWRHLAPLLASRARVIAPDLPGHGFTDPAPRGQASLQGMSQSLAALLEALQVTPASVSYTHLTLPTKRIV